MYRYAKSYPKSDVCKEDYKYMKKTDVLVNSLVYAVYMILSCIVVMFAEMLVIKVVNVLVEIDYFELCIIRAVIYTVGVNALLAIIAFREGYRAAYFQVASTAISASIASLMHFLFALLFSFEAFAAGGVKFISALVQFGTKLNLSGFSGKLDIIATIPFFFLVALVYVSVMITFGKLGEKRRLISRKELTGSQSTEA